MVTLVGHSSSLHAIVLWATASIITGHYFGWIMLLFQVVQLLTFGSENSFNSYVICFHFNLSCWYSDTRASAWLWLVSSGLHHSAHLPLIAAITMTLQGTWLHAYCVINHCSLSFSSSTFLAVACWWPLTWFWSVSVCWVRFKQAFLISAAFLDTVCL